MTPDTGSEAPVLTAPDSTEMAEPAVSLSGRPIVEYNPDEDLTKLYEQTMVPIAEGSLVTGKVVQIDDDEALLDIGYKSEGVIPARELSIRRDIKTRDVVQVGDEVEATVLVREDRDGRLILSKKRAQYERAWDTIAAIKEADGVVKGTVIETVKGGLIVDVGLRGFLPASLVEMRRVRDLEPYLGQELEAKILEIDRSRNNVVLSRRDLLTESQKEQREEFLANLEVGEIRSGVIASIVPFGAFVDMGGIDGLVHVSEISWKHIKHPSEVIEIGDEVQVKITSIDLEKEQVSLSIKKTQRPPGEEFAETHKVGELVYGRIIKLMEFGAFVQIGEFVEGLVHISELSHNHVDHPDQVVSEGEELWVKIIGIEKKPNPNRPGEWDYRTSLSIRQAAEGGEVASEYQEHFGDHAFDEEGNFVGGVENTEATAETAEVDQITDELATGEIASETESGAEVSAETPEVSLEATEAEPKAEISSESSQESVETSSVETSESNKS